MGAGNTQATGTTLSAPSQSSGTTVSTSQPSHADPGDELELQDIPFASTGTKPRYKPTARLGRVYWDGKGGPDLLSKTRACLAFWKELAHTVSDAEWTSTDTWWYVKEYGSGGDLTQIVSDCTNMEELKLRLERKYLRSVTVAQLTTPIYQLRQGQLPLEEYASKGRRTWKEVGDLIPQQEAASVHTWVGQINPAWARMNQAVYQALQGCKSWTDVEEAVAHWSSAINELPVQRKGTENPPLANNAGAAGVGATGAAQPQTQGQGTTDGGSRGSRTGAGCWICKSPDHLKRDCPDRVNKSQGKGLGGSE